MNATVKLGRRGRAALPYSPAAFFCIVGFFALLAMPLAAQSPAGGTTGTGDSTISFSAARMESVLAKGKEKTILIGAATVETGSMEIKADRIELSGTDYNDVVCTGNVVVLDDSKGFLLKTDTLNYARDTEIGLAQKQVVLEDSKNNVLLKADWVRFDQKQSLVEARIGVHILKEDFAARAEFVRYNRDDESLVLSGTPVAVSEDGRIQADTITGKAEGLQSLDFSGRVSGTITPKKQEGTSP
jgi:lipopolysaccharide export system protein LptA